MRSREAADLRGWTELNGLIRDAVRCTAHRVPLHSGRPWNASAAGLLFTPSVRRFRARIASRLATHPDVLN